MTGLPLPPSPASGVAFARLALIILILAQVCACSLPGRPWPLGDDEAPATTYRKVLARAEAGYAESQNIVGFMLFHGEGVRVDRNGARQWFERAAAQGHDRAQRNLAFMNSPEPFGYRGPSPQRAQAPVPGESLYQKFCGGCHGFNGISAYVHSPSFALGEQLEKSDAELMRSMLRGKGEMPNWDDKLSIGELQDVLRFVRTLRTRYEVGIAASLSSAPQVFYLFGPMAPDSTSYRRFDRSHGFVQPPASY